MKNYFLCFFLGESSFLSGQDFSPFLQDSFLSHPDLHFPQQDFPSFFSHGDLSQSDFTLSWEYVPRFESPALKP